MKALRASVNRFIAANRSEPLSIRPEWQAEFAADCYSNTLPRIIKLFMAATALNLVALVGYDLPLYLGGLYDQYRMYTHLLIWRIANIAMLSLWLAAAIRLGRTPTQDAARRMTLIAIPIALLLCVWHGALSQMLSNDVSIYALVVLVVAGLIVTPSRRKLIVYPVSLAVLMISVVLINPNPLVVYAVGVNSFCLTACAMLADQVWYRAAVRNFVLRKTLTEERGRADNLLRNIMPDAVVDRLKRGESHVVEFHDEVSVIFADVADFTRMSSELSPQRLISILEMLFKAFDDIADQCGVEKIKTVGDAYMAAAGVPAAVADHADRVARMALAMMAACDRLRAESGYPLNLRVGIATGPAISGVIAQKKFAFDLWGDTVNMASRMETSGVAGRIHVTDAFRQALGDRYRFEQRGILDVKGKAKGVTPSYFLVIDSEARAA